MKTYMKPRLLAGLLLIAAHLSITAAQGDIQGKPSPPVEKEGICPFVDRRLIRCAQPAEDNRLCPDDNSCKEKQKCCNTGCSYGCVDPAPPKQGKCPTSSNVDCDNTLTCDSDSGCPGNQLCCYSNCGDTRCLDAVKPGYCPPSPEEGVSTCLASCVNDFDCGNGTMKCCNEICNIKCVEAVPAVTKDGNCPQFDWRVKCMTQPGVCENDAQCRGIKKCCKSPCGPSTNCFDPVKPGDCPPLNPLLDCAQPETGSNAEPAACTNDTACAGKQKCCPVQCKANQCQDPVTPVVKAGECPGSSDDGVSGSSGDGVRHCESDAGCWGTAKCCPQPGGGSGCSEPDTCTLPAEPGRCKGAFERWFFDWKAKKCTTFTWGGCDDGNANRFEDEAACQAKCQPKETVVDICTLPADPGSCEAAIKRWFFDSNAGRCTTFTWGGCEDGNANNFKDEAECEANCPTIIEEGCAYYDKDIVCIQANTRECEPSQKCDSGDLCCSYWCGTRCQKNACPAFDRTRICKKANDKNCTDSTQCGEGQLCCEYECEGTKCYNPECPLTSCDVCQCGCVKDKSGCVTCNTCPNPCETVQCKENEYCKVQTIYCLVAPCPPPRAECVPKPTGCPMRKCQACEYGYLIGKDGCPSCDCARDPCEKFDCPSYQICEPEEIKCDDGVPAPCMKAKCVPNQKNICTLPADPGSCKAAFVRWFFDSNAGRCTTFTWGGCDDGNANNFKDEAECQANCPTIARQTENPPANEKTGGGQGSPGNSPAGSDGNGTPPRAGTCPADRVGRKFKSDEPCSNDNTCPGNKKCCSRGGVKVCRSPDAPKAGACPNVIKRKLTKGKPVVMKCDCDGECCDNQKCCETETGAYECTVPGK